MEEVVHTRNYADWISNSPFLFDLFLSFHLDMTISIYTLLGIFSIQCSGKRVLSVYAYLTSFVDPTVTVTLSSALFSLLIMRMSKNRLFL